jgi:hypothetical protein
VGGPAAIWESGDLVARYAWPAEASANPHDVQKR